MLPELNVLRDNWETIREEAQHLFAQGQIKAADKYNDWGFNSFFRSGWKRFYLKWYGDALPSAERMCPRTVALLRSIPCIKGAMFATLAPGGRFVQFTYGPAVPVRRGLLFAASERAVYVSFDDGDHWQSLRLNMPATSVRDVIVKDDDLAVGTHGRGFWILDDITPLRQLDEKVVSSDAFLFKPQTAIRVRWNMNTDTPLPPDFPAGQNPPDGAVINYYLQSASRGPVTLEIKDSAGATVRKLPDNVAVDWATSLKAWPQEKAGELDKAGLPASQVLKLAIEEAEKLGHKWPVRYQVN